MRVPPAHRPVDLHRPVRNLRHAPRRIPHGVPQHLPNEPAVFVVALHERSQPRRQVLRHRRQPRLVRLPILKRLPIEGVNLLLRPDALVKSLPRFLAQPPIRHHLIHERRRLQPLPPRVVRHHPVQVLRHVHPDIEPDNIQQPVAGRIRQPDHGARQRVHLFNAEVVLHRVLVGARAPHAADAIGDEVRRILADHHALAQPPVKEPFHVGQQQWVRFVTWYHLAQVQVTRRVKKVRSQEVLPESCIEARADLCQRNPRSVRRNDRVGRTQRRASRSRPPQSSRTRRPSAGRRQNSPA